jgi:hypothetical protein
MSYLSGYTYAQWQKYLADGRKKYERPLYAARGWRIKYANNFSRQGDIEVYARWAGAYAFITIHPDDTKTISYQTSVTTAWGGTWNPMRSSNIKYTIWKFTGVQVVQRNFGIRIIEQDAGLTPVKIQGCRTCRQSGLVDSWCGQTVCWDVVSNNNVISCPTHPDADISKANYGSHIMPCPHGNTNGHTVKRGGQCYSCNGTKKASYGGKRISLPWDGSPLRVKDGNIISQAQVQTVSVPTNLERMLAQYVQSSSVR